MPKQKNITVNKKKDLLTVIFLNFLGLIYFYLTKNTFLEKPLLVYAAFTLPPIIYLTSRKKFNWTKIILATLILGAVIGFTFDFINEYVKTWTVIRFVFPLKIFGVEPIDNTLWYTMMTFYTLLFYEYFLDHEKIHKISRHFKFIFYFSIFSLLTMLGIYFSKPTSLNIAYPYATLGLAAIILPVTIGFLKPKLINKMFLTGLYFFFLYFIFEIIAVSDKYWLFNGNNYIGTVNFLGLVFPLEELFFWMMFYAPTIITFYEVFFDDEK
jgi:hypothetical protein